MAKMRVDGSRQFHQCFSGGRLMSDVLTLHTFGFVDDEGPRFELAPTAPAAGTVCVERHDLSAALRQAP